MRIRAACPSISLVLLLGLAIPAAAQRDHDGPNPSEWQTDGRIDRFPPDADAWRGGRWSHEWHEGRDGWDAGPNRYPFDARFRAGVSPPPLIVIEPRPLTTGIPPGSVWYVCDNPPGYAPYVATCNEPWREVPATPFE
jgi:hypothetical protein